MARNKLFTAQQLIEHFSDDEGDLGEDYFSCSSDDEDFDSHGNIDLVSDEDLYLDCGHDLGLDGPTSRGERDGHGPGIVGGVLALASSQKISPRLNFCIAHDGGYVRSLCWCPKGCFDETDPKEVGDSKEAGSCSIQEKLSSKLPRLGLLAAACSDATIHIFSIPHMSSIDSLIQSTSDNHTLIIVKPKPCLKLVPNSRSDATPCLSVSWQHYDGCEQIIGGYGRGEVLMWSLASSSAVAQEDIKTVYPIRAFLRHKSGVVTCAWCPSLPHLFVSCDYSGFIYLWNSNRLLEPESVLKRAGILITKAICMAGPVHWGFFTANDRTALPNSHLRVTDNYLVNFHGFSPQSGIFSEFKTTVLVHSACAWDVTFDPVFNILVYCDAAGNVCVALPKEDYLLCSYHPNYSFPAKTLQMLLYKLSITSEDKDPDPKKKTSSQAATDGKKTEKVQQSDQVEKMTPRTKLSKNDSKEQTSVPVNDSEAVSKKNFNKETASLSVICERDPKSLSQNKKAPDSVMLCYHDFTEGELFKKPGDKIKKKGMGAKQERENFAGSGLESIQRVRLCPGMDSNLWLASGGNAGILRFDRLHDLVIQHTKRIKEKVEQLKESTKDDDS